MTFHNRHIRFPWCHTIPNAIKFLDLPLQFKIELVLRYIPCGQDHGIIPIKIHHLIGIDIEALDQGSLNLKDSDVRGKGHPLPRQPLSCQVEILQGSELTACKKRWCYNMNSFALIRQESLFESSARSYAQAIGLMQVIPSTGEWIAHRLDWPDFAPTHLTRPYLNVHFGTWYLAQGLNAFQGDLFAALAAYNSGLASPSRWLDAAGGDPDLFVETIDYSQTRHYVQLIYQQHALYRQIYQPQ